jgi:uncharacterized protein (TIGR02646 family)
MRRLDRALAPRPDCLDAYHWRTHTWDAVKAEHKDAMRTSLDGMQTGRCAYCEGPLYTTHDLHIEHFRRKNPNHYRQFTFEWTNLFLACQSTDHCGHYKDRQGADPYDPRDVVKPDDEDPDLCFYLHSDGRLYPQPGADELQVKRAQATEKVFNLNEPHLREARRGAINRFLKDKDVDFEAILSFAPADRAAWLQDEIAASAHLPYCTTLRHFLERHA